MVQGGHPPSRPRGHQVGGSRSAQGGGSIIGWPWRPAVGCTLGQEPAGPHWSQPGQSDWSAFVVTHIHSQNGSFYFCVTFNSCISSHFSKVNAIVYV